LIGLPIKLHKGMISQAVVKIPWASMWKEPLIISLKNIYIVGSTMEKYCSKYHDYRDSIIK